MRSLRRSPFRRSRVARAALALAFLVCTACSDEKSSSGEGSSSGGSSRAGAPAEPLVLRLPAWEDASASRSHWKSAGDVHSAVQAEKQLALEVQVQGGGAKTVLAALAFAEDRPGVDPEPAGGGMAEKPRGGSWKLELKANSGVWSKVGGARPLRIEIGAFDPSAYDTLARFFDDQTLSPADRRGRWKALTDVALARKTAEIFVMTAEPRIELPDTLGTSRLDAGANGLAPALPLRIRSLFLERLEVDGKTVPASEWGFFPEPGSGAEANERLVVLPWPRKGAGFVTSIAVIAVDRLGREKAVSVEHVAPEGGPRAPYLRTDVRCAASGELEGWANAGDPSRWTFLAQDEHGAPRRQHRMVASGAAAILSFRVDAGEERIAELVHAPGVLPVLGATNTRRLLTSVPSGGGLLHFEVPLPEPEADEWRCHAVAWCELKLWPRSALTSGAVPELSGVRADIAARAGVGTYHLQIFRDDAPPQVDVALGDGAKVRFPDGGDALFEMAARCRFPSRLEILGRENEGSLEDGDWIDSGASYVGRQRLTLAGRQIRGFALPWPRGADGAPALEVPVVLADRLGRETQRTFRFALDAGIPPLPQLAPTPASSVRESAEPARLVLETSCGGGRSVPRFEWEVARAADATRDVIVRRRVSVFPMETVRVHVAAPPGDYRVELVVVAGIYERQEGLSDAVFRAQGGDVLQFAFDLRSLGARDANLAKTYARFALFRAEDRPDCKAARRGDEAAALAAKALGYAQIDLFRDNAVPAFVFDTPPRAVVNPLPDPERCRPPAVFGVALFERFPLDLVFDGRRIDLADPLATDARDPGGEDFAREEHSFAWDWPAREDGEQSFRLGVRDRLQRWREAEHTVLFDRVPPALASAQREKGEGGAVALVLEASEALRDATWTEAGEGGAVLRFLVDGKTARATFPASVTPRRGVARLTDLAGNAFETELSPDGE